MHNLVFNWLPDFYLNHKGINCGINVSTLKPKTKLEVFTANSIYEIDIVDGLQVDVKGGKYFPVVKREILAGSTLGDSAIKPGWICYDMHLEFGTPLYYILTSRVKNVIVRGKDWCYNMGWDRK